MNLTAGQIIHVCMDCRKVKISSEWWIWVQVPAHLVDRVSHGICPDGYPVWQAKIDVEIEKARDR